MVKRIGIRSSFAPSPSTEALMSTFSIRARAATIVTVFALAASLQMIAAVPAGAADALRCQIPMQLAMKVVPITHKTEFTVLTGGGSCVAAGGGTYVVQVLGGTGHTQGFGPGVGCPTQVTRDFTLEMSVALTNTSTGLVRT